MGVDLDRDASSAVRPIVLVVDDHPDTAEMLQEYLVFRGVRCVHTTSVAEAKEVLETIAVDVIVTDYAMPDVDGLAFLRRLRRTERGAAMPVVVVSGHDHRGEIARAANDLDAQFVTKPFELEKLVAAVQAALSASSAARAGRGAGRRALFGDEQTEPAIALAPADVDSSGARSIGDARARTGNAD